MNEVTRAHRDILIALLIQYHRDRSSPADLSDLRTEYHAKIPDYLLPSSIEPWNTADWLYVSETKDDTAALILESHYSAAHGRVLEYLNASTLRVDAKKEEICSDTKIADDIPLPEDWKWYTYDDPEPVHNGVTPTRLASSSWTGLPSEFVLTEQKRLELTTLLGSAELALDSSGASNSEKAMARAYIVAAKTLADAPDPPADLIWELIQRANSLSGIASLVVSIIALFAVAGR